MLADMTLPAEAWAAINSVAVAVTAIVAYLGHRKNAVANTATNNAVERVHEVAKTDPSINRAKVTAADNAVAALPKT